VGAGEGVGTEAFDQRVEEGPEVAQKEIDGNPAKQNIGRH
jgi:hypothetical protein